MTSRKRVRKGPQLRPLIKEWTELRDIELDAGKFHVITLQLHKTPSAPEFDDLSLHFKKLLAELDDNGIKGVGMVLVPGQQLQVFELEEEKPKRGRRRRT